MINLVRTTHQGPKPRMAVTLTSTETLRVTAGKQPFVNLPSRVIRLLSGYVRKYLPGHKKRIDFPVDEVTVSVDEETGKSVFIDGEN